MPQDTGKNDLQQFDASIDEEIDALELNLQQDGDDFSDDRDSTGPIEDDLSRDQIEGMTEAGPDLVNKGVDNVAPGTRDTSETLRRHQPTSNIVRDHDQSDANPDEPRDEAFSKRWIP